jgi:hypothetical protein
MSLSGLLRQESDVLQAVKSLSLLQLIPVLDYH